MIEIKFNLCQIVFISLLVISCLYTTKMIVNRSFWVLGNEVRSTPTTSLRTWTTSQLAGQTGTLFSIWMEVFFSLHPGIQSHPRHLTMVLHSSEMASFLWQVSIAAFLILVDYFSSIPVTKKNLVTQQTQLLITFMTFFVCLQASDLTQCFGPKLLVLHNRRNASLVNHVDNHQWTVLFKCQPLKQLCLFWSIYMII